MGTATAVLDAPDSSTAGWSTAAAEVRTSGVAQLRAAQWQSSTSMPPMPPPPPPMPRVPARWQRVARPAGVLPAAALAGIVGASVLPMDRPGIGWLVTGAAVTAALCAVDHRARTRPATDSAPSTPAPSDPKPTAPQPTGASVTPTGTSAATKPDRAVADTTGTSLPTKAVDASAGPVPDKDSAVEGDPAGGTGPDEKRPATDPALPLTAVAPGMPGSLTGGPVSGAVRPGWRDRVWWAAAALVLLGVGAVRAAGWLFVLCVLGAVVAGSLAVLGRRSARGTVYDMLAVPLAVFGAVPWAFSGVRAAQARPAKAGWQRYGVSVAATAALLVVFVPLLGGADATFAGLLSGLVPEVDGASAWQWILLFGAVGAGALGALYLLAGPPEAATAAARPRRLWSRGEWVLPVGALVVLFGAFVGAQFVALFGGDDYVQRTAGLTYAQYARSGFWQLSAVSILTLGVIFAVLHWSAQDSAADRRWLRVLLSALSVLTLVIVGSALGRMWTYQQAYGFTVLRLLVQLCELWVGLVYVLVLVAIARLRWSWVSRAAVGTALGTLIALAVVNPEGFVADRNIARWQDGERLDTVYLRQLSPDVLPALRELPDPLRTDIETPILADLDSEPWWAWNFSRSTAR
ncbi:DUF4153 domain-containing protein [Nocardia sp. NPDC004415]